MSDRPRTQVGAARVTQVLVLGLGLLYLTLAVVGFVETGVSDFSRNPENVMLGFGVSTLLNIVHAGTGVAAVLLARTRNGTQVFGLLAMVAFTALFAYGVVAAVGEGPGEPLNVNWADNWLHLATALVGVVIVLVGLRARTRTARDER